jgi:hypothetical protein
MELVWLGSLIRREAAMSQRVVKNRTGFGSARRGAWWRFFYFYFALPGRRAALAPP